jgi:hypothetical protein
MTINNTMYTYTLGLGCILRSDGAHIPMDTGNSDYVDYLLWVAQGNTAAPVSEPDTSVLITQYSNQIDNTVADVYSAFTRFQQEYTNRENAAQAYTNAGYTGDPTMWVTSFSDAAGLTPQQGAVKILQQATLLNGALMALAAQRMRKYELVPTLDAAGLLAVYNSIINDINSIASELS